jgi:hypothetical protein
MGARNAVLDATELEEALIVLVEKARECAVREPTRDQIEAVSIAIIEAERALEKHGGRL